MIDANELRNDEIAQLYAAGVRADAIAEQLGLSTPSVYRILSQPSVRSKVTELRAEQLRPILDLCRKELESNVEVLREVKLNDKANARLRVAAVNELNKMFLSVFNIVETQTRLAILEANLPETPTEESCD